MEVVSIALNYFSWHYSTAYVDMFYIWRNYLWFVNHLFAVPEVALNLFAPFKRLQEGKVNPLLRPEEFFSNLFVNLIMRLVGICLRLTILLLALLCFLIVLIGGLLFLVFWTILPFLTVRFLLMSLGYFFS